MKMKNLSCPMIIYDNKGAGKAMMAIFAACSDFFPYCL